MNIELGIGIGGGSLFAPTSSDQLVAYAWASAVSPSVSTSSVVHVSVSSVTANSSASALSPNISSAGNVTILPVVANANGDALIPSVAIAGSISINAVIASSNLDSIIPVISTIRNVSVDGIVANSTALAGVPTVSIGGAASYYLQMDGVDDKVVSINPSLLKFGTGAFTLEIKANIKKYNIELLSKRPYQSQDEINPGYPQFRLFINSNGTILFITYKDSESSIATSASDLVPLNQDVTIKATRDSTGVLSIYYDEVLKVQSSALSLANINNDGDFGVGVDLRNNAAYAEMDVKYVKVSDSSTLVLHYDMSTGTVLDQSGNGNHATLTGGTWVVA